METNTAVTVVGGSISFAAIVVALVRWSLSRNLQNEDAWKAATTAAIATESKVRAEAVEALRLENAALRQKLTETTHAQQLAQTDLAGKLTHLTGNIGELKGLVAQLGAQLENNRDKMSKFYREELAATEERMRKDVEALIKPRKR